MDLSKYSTLQQRLVPCSSKQQPAGLNLTQQQPGLVLQIPDPGHQVALNNSTTNHNPGITDPLPSTSSAAGTSGSIPRCPRSSPERSNPTSSLIQLLTSPRPTVLHRPTPIHPVASRLFSFATRAPAPEIDHHNQQQYEVPLDLSQSSTAVKQQMAYSKLRQQQQSKFLPTCANPNLNSNWIAIKFGAAAGPNRMSYPREFKLMVINYYYTNGQNKYRTCKEFQITKSMLNGWLQKMDKIRRSRPGSLKSGRSGRKPQFPDIEKQLFHLYHAHLGTGKKVGNRWIRETARNLAQQQCSEQELAGMCQFSERWLSNFKKRYRINLNRDWSSGNSSSGSLGSAESVGSGSSSTAGSGHPSPEKSDEAVENESIDSDADSVLSDSLETLVDVDDSTNPENPLALLASGTFPTAQEHVREILNKPGQLPIQAFYERFPWLCRKNQTGAEPGRRGRKVQFPGVEKVLFERLQKEQSKGERISNRWLQQQARELALQICPEVLREATKSARCLFSEHWLHNFKKRYGVTLKQSKNTVTNASSPSKNSEISPSAAAVHQYDNTSLPLRDSHPSVAATADGATTMESNGSSARAVPQQVGTTTSATDLTTVLQLQNWFLMKYVPANPNPAPAVPNSVPRSNEPPAVTPAPVWYPTPLTQSLL